MFLLGGYLSFLLSLLVTQHVQPVFQGLAGFPFHLLPFVLCFLFSSAVRFSGHDRFFFSPSSLCPLLFTHRVHPLFQDLSWRPFCMQSALTIVVLSPGPYQSFVTVKSPGANKTPLSAPSVELHSGVCYSGIWLSLSVSR